MSAPRFTITFNAYGQKVTKKLKTIICNDNNSHEIIANQLKQELNEITVDELVNMLKNINLNSAISEYQKQVHYLHTDFFDRPVKTYQSPPKAPFHRAKKWLSGMWKKINVFLANMATIKEDEDDLL